MKQFEICWAELREPAGRRPVPLLNRNDAYGYLSKFIAAEITSNIRQIASEVSVGEEEGLPKPCVANCDNIRVVPKVSLTKACGGTRAGALDRSKAGVGAAHPANGGLAAALVRLNRDPVKWVDCGDGCGLDYEFRSGSAINGEFRMASRMFWRI